MPISQNVYKSAMWPVANLARNFMDFRLPAATLAVTRAIYTAMWRSGPRRAMSFDGATLRRGYRVAVRIVLDSATRHRGNPLDTSRRHQRSPG
jgi:hypothetical protein